MPALTPTLFLSLSDKLAAAYLALLGTTGSGYGLGTGAPVLSNDWGYSAKTRGYQNLLLASQDPDILASLLPSASRAVAQAPVKVLVASLLYPLFQDLARLCQKAGLPAVTDAASFAQYYNVSVGGNYACLVSPEYAALYALMYTGVPFPVSGVYAPAQTNMGQRSVGGAFTTGSTVDPLLYSGVQAVVVLSSVAGTATGVLTLTGTARDASGVVQTARAYSAPGSTANGTFSLVPTISGDVLLSVTSLVLPPGITAGTAIVSASLPSGRVSPPV